MKIILTFYNCKNIRISKSTQIKHYILQLLNKCDILFLSKTWLYENDAKDKQNQLPDHVIYAKSAMRKLSVNGRPHGGIAIDITSGN